MSSPDTIIEMLRLGYHAELAKLEPIRMMLEEYGDRLSAETRREQTEWLHKWDRLLTSKLELLDDLEAGLMNGRLDDQANKESVILSELEKLGWDDSE